MILVGMIGKKGVQWKIFPSSTEEEKKKERKKEKRIGVLELALENQ